MRERANPISKDEYEALRTEFSQLDEEQAAVERFPSRPTYRRLLVDSVQKARPYETYLRLMDAAKSHFGVGGDR